MSTPSPAPAGGGRQRPEVVVIAAVAEAPGTPSDRLIGDGLELPWHLPTDFKRFKTFENSFLGFFDCLHSR